MLDLLALTVLIIWGLGIVLQAFGIAHVAKNPEHEMHDRLHGMVDQAGLATVVSLLTVLVLFWPAALAYNTVTKNRK